ncbi:CDP-alcohol phosphatidyltransferase family protein [Kocuria rosea]|uniref:CDP-alcohol phosphatidyltransferase family protein n=1 Tax=Kocuria rosea TaxID=1275 RepID=UPI00117295DC|nr:CDP-alcohol phosphatidyltransferase family protein [Kocuria rosea]TQN35774.1 CDP-alcohol phosphatidyltransferase-like enzyme [Kocuria rosea]
MSTTDTAAPRHRPSYEEALAGLRAAQKPGQGVPAYTRWVNRPLARYAAARAAAAGLTPNGVTALSAVLSAAGLVVLVAAPPTPATGVVVALLLAAGYVLDSADGQVARLTGTGSPAGEWLDHVVDSIRTPALHLAVAAAALLHPGPRRSRQRPSRCSPRCSCSWRSASS